MLSHTLIPVLLLALGCKAQTVPCGDACPGANGYLIPTTTSSGLAGHNYRLICGEDLNTGKDLVAIAGLGGAQACAQECESWNGLKTQPPCTGALFNAYNHYCFLKSGTLVGSPSTLGDALVLVA